MLDASYLRIQGYFFTSLTRFLYCTTRRCIVIPSHPERNVRPSEGNPISFYVFLTDRWQCGPRRGSQGALPILIFKDVRPRGPKMFSVKNGYNFHTFPLRPIPWTILNTEYKSNTLMAFPIGQLKCPPPPPF